MPSVARNTTVLTASFILQKVLAFIYFTLIARLTGVSFTGSYVFALSFSAMFSVLVDLGLSPVLIREVARNKKVTSKYLNNIVGLKMLLGVLSFFIIVISAYLIEPSSLGRLMIYIAALLMISDSFVLTFWSVFRGGQDLRFEAIGIVLGQIITFGVGLGGLFLHYPLYILIVALLLGSLFNLFFSWFLLIKRLHIIPKLQISKRVLTAMFAIGLPFALLHVFTRLVFSIDIVLLRKLAGAIYVGWYSVAHKITFAFQFLPSAFSASLFPAMSEAFIKNKERLTMLFEQSSKYLIIVAIPLSTGVMLLADDIINHIYTVSFANSVLALQIIVWSSMLLFLTFPVGALLNATNHQMRNALHLGIVVLLMIVLNIILIPRYQHIGSAIASVITWATLLTLNLLYSRKIIKINYKSLLSVLGRVIIASALMSVLVIFLKTFVVKGSIGVIYDLILIPIMGALSYIIAIFVLRVLTKQELAQLKRRILHQ